jgi:hypothetical protein
VISDRTNSSTFPVAAATATIAIRTVTKIEQAGRTGRTSRNGMPINQITTRTAPAPDLSYSSRGALAVREHPSPPKSQDQFSSLMNFARGLTDALLQTFPKGKVGGLGDFMRDKPQPSSS